MSRSGSLLLFFVITIAGFKLLTLVDGNWCVNRKYLIERDYRDMRNVCGTKDSSNILGCLEYAEKVKRGALVSYGFKCL